MGLFGYRFRGLTPLEVDQRREKLDFHATVAQASLGVVLLIIQIYFVLSWMFRRCFSGDLESRPSSPKKKFLGEKKEKGLIRKFATFGRRSKWWLGEEIVRGYGTRGIWIGGIGWSLWLAILCVRDTGDDYMHLTKRFAIVAASQLPMHYLLAVKSSYSPIQILLQTSHENLNAIHQVLGRIIILFLLLHASFYLNFFILNDLIATRIKDRDVIIGLTSMSSVSLLGSTALGYVRTRNYRIFYTIHVIVGSAILPLLFFHVTHIRPFIVECGIIHVGNFILRYWNTRKEVATMSIIPGTNLLHIVIPRSGSLNRFKPGQHVYLSSAVHGKLSSNPFTIASLPGKDGELELIARTLKGNTKRLAALAGRHEASDGTSDEHSTQILLNIEGPYGHSAYLPDFSHMDRILLVAGGVGATYIIPLWRYIVDHRDEKGLKDSELRFVWAVRKLEDAKWAFKSQPSIAKARGLETDEKEIYVSGTEVEQEPETSPRKADSIELRNRQAGPDIERDVFRDRGFEIVSSRPNLREIADEIFFGSVDRVAVFCCGPATMTRQLRNEVGRWVQRGKEVYWHAEEFGL